MPISRPFRQSALSGAVCLFALSLAACASTGSVSGTKSTVTTDAEANRTADINGLDPVAAAAFWGTRYDRNPTDPEAAVRYSEALRKIGSQEDSIKVMQKISSKAPQNPDVAFEFGKSLIEANRAFEAVRHIEMAKANKPNDWRILSAYGVALDQIGQHDLAREQYDYALQLSPMNISLLNNKGLSFALSGNLDRAIATLTKASGNRQASATVRQNLALVMALKGDTGKAEQLARGDLPPSVADNNVEFFQSLLGQPAYWQDVAANTVETPDFDADFSADSDGAAEDMAAGPEVLVAPAPEPSFEAETISSEPVAPSSPQPVDEMPVAPTVSEPEIEAPVPETDDNFDGVPLVQGPAVLPSTASFDRDDDQATDQLTDAEIDAIVEEIFRKDQALQGTDEDDIEVESVPIITVTDDENGEAPAAAADDGEEN